MVEIIYEDNHLLVLNKPAGLLTQPSGTTQDSLEAQGKQFIKTRDHKPGNVFLEAAHRLDRPVSGIVLFAKTSKALSRLQQAIRERHCEKTYLALVEGAPPKPEATLEHTLLHTHHKAEVHPDGKPAILNYKALKSTKNSTLLEIQLITGRYHQIRAQLAVIGCPILGDTKYGSTHPSKTIALHHTRLTISHPTTKEELIFESPPPFSTTQHRP